MPDLTHSLRSTLKKLARSTSVDQLVKRGVKQVNVVGLDRIVYLIQEAVRRSLHDRMLGLDREAVAGATKDEFIRLLQSHQTLEKTHDEVVRKQQVAEEQLDELRRQLQSSQQMLRDRLATAERDLRARFEGENTEIIDRVSQIFLDQAEAGGDAADLRDRVVELVMDVVGRERQATIQARQGSHDREVDLLQRRIEKLQGSLEHTERELATVASMKGIEDGISSIYREVQGLDAADQLYSRKKELMSDIFRANLALQKGETAET